jgi:4-diphosphocytidyl-2-C-methyl-D-erythritol kinase
MRSALATGEIARIAAALCNDLQAPACALHPEITAALRLLSEAGAAGVTMSGSGSTVFGLVPTEARGREIAALLNAKGLAAWCVHTLVP